MAGKEAAIRAVAELADHVHWVREWPDKPTWRDRLRRWVYPESYRFDRTAAPPKPWVDRPPGPTNGPVGASERHTSVPTWLSRSSMWSVICARSAGWNRLTPVRATSAAASPQLLSGRYAAPTPEPSGTRGWALPRVRALREFRQCGRSRGLYPAGKVPPRGTVANAVSMSTTSRQGVEGTSDEAVQRHRPHHNRTRTSGEQRRVTVKSGAADEATARSFAQVSAQNDRL
jgi:hypothetical protein